LLGDFFLPPSNNISRTYCELSTIMKDIRMEYQVIDACPNDHIIYYGQYALETKFHSVKSVDIEPIK
jgi:hypothetical protein